MSAKHGYSKLKAGLSRTAGLWENHHDDGTKTQVVVQDQSDNVPGGEAGYVVYANRLHSDGSEENIGGTVIGYAYSQSDGREVAEDWMESNSKLEVE